MTTTNTTQPLCPTCQHFKDHGWTEGECLCAELDVPTATTTQTGDLDLARHLMTEDSFQDGHTGLDACEYVGEAAPSEPGTVSVHLNGEVVDSLLAQRGWQRIPYRETAWWIAPDGEKVWHRDEALTLALTAEAC